MQRSLKTLLVAGAATVVMAPIQARADGFVSPWVGLAFGSRAGIRNDLAPLESSNQTILGISVGGMRSGLVGGEVDFGYGPSFFGTSTLFGKNTLATLMGNVIVGIPMGSQRGPSIRPYVTAGLGLLHSQIQGGTLSYPAPSDDGLGWNAGAGVMGYFSGHVGLRGDLRYLRAFKERDIGFSIGDSTPDRDGLTALRLWRASIGVVFR